MAMVAAMVTGGLAGFGSLAGSLQGLQTYAPPDLLRGQRAAGSRVPRQQIDTLQWEAMHSAKEGWHRPYRKHSSGKNKKLSFREELQNEIDEWLEE